MDDDFDPYHKWLGIPKNQRPPTFYQLLGVSTEEEDPEAVHAASKQRQDYIRQFLTGPNRSHVESLLFQLQEARQTLLSPTLRDAYDSKIGLIHRRQRQPTRYLVYGNPGSHSGAVGEETGLARRLFPILGVIALVLTATAAMTYRNLIGSGKPQVAIGPIAVPAVVPRPLAENPAPQAAPVVNPNPPAIKEKLSLPPEKKAPSKEVASSILPEKAISTKEPDATPQQTNSVKSPPEEPHVTDGPPAGHVITNSIDMKLVLIPAGSFSMGAAATEFDARAKDQPQHSVRITHPFFLGKFEVTRGQFRKFVEEQDFRTQGERDGTGGYGFSGRRSPAFVHHRSYTWKNPGFPQNDEHPVVLVSWFDANAFCSWLSQKESKRYRLPTEAEWEYASRGRSSTRWSHGETLPDLSKFANIADSALSKKYLYAEVTKSLNDEFPFTAPVGKFLPNGFGVYDMMGNVFEWCNDWGSDSYYSSSPKDNPAGPTSGSKRVLRGGSWFQTAVQAKPSYRDHDLPTNSNAFLGFRVVQVLSEKP